jgi:hypothetical protein
MRSGFTRRRPPIRSQPKIHPKFGKTQHDHLSSAFSLVLQPDDYSESMEIIANVKRVHRPFWSCFHEIHDEIASVDAQASLLMERINAMTSAVHLDFSGTNALEIFTSSESEADLDPSGFHSEIFSRTNSVLEDEVQSVEDEVGAIPESEVSDDSLASIP